MDCDRCAFLDNHQYIALVSDAFIDRDFHLARLFTQVCRPTHQSHVLRVILGIL